MQYKWTTLGVWSAVIAFVFATCCAILLSGCVTQLEDIPQKAQQDADQALASSQPELNDSKELAAAKAEFARSRQKWTEEREKLTATITSIRGKSSAEISKLQEELAQQKRLNEQIIRQADEKFRNEQFPYQWFYGGAAVLILGVIVIAYWKKDVILIAFGIAGAIMLIGIATAQKMYPEYLMYCALGCAAPVILLVIVLCISWLRKEWTIEVMARAIESDRHDPKAVIKEDESIAKKLERQIRKYIPLPKEKKTDAQTQQA